MEQKRRENAMLAVVAQTRGGTRHQLTCISVPGASYHLILGRGVAVDAWS